MSALPIIDEIREHFFIVGHRGAKGLEPENTILSIRKALEIGVDAVEVDVRASKDGYPVIIHDDTVDRTTNGSGLVADMTLDELRKLDAGKGEKIPLFEEVLREVHGKAVLFVEFKVADAIDAVLKIVDSMNAWKSILFISFESDHLLKVKEYNKDAYTGLIYFKQGDGIILAKKIGALAVLPFYRMATEKAVAFAKKLRLMVIPWVVNDLETGKRLKSYGVNGLTTDRPDIMIKLRDSNLLT
ncbi:MAG: glycerophosphodiester phosphodiesterase [Thermoprotei archaeon]|nr:MAG: glycerophosphodiester phosphodiesterase [Thermoprotei archaeon]